MAVLDYSFLLKSRMVNNCLLADTGPTTSVTAYSGSRPADLQQLGFVPLISDDNLAHMPSFS